MKRLPPVFLLLAVLGSAAAGVSRVDLLTIDFGMEGDTLVTVTGIHGVQGADRLLGRMVVGFDPALQSVRLLEASSGWEGSPASPVPSWAVDTLAGTGGMPLSLVVAYPALRDGMEMTFRVEVRDWAPMRDAGPWSMIVPNVRGIAPESTRVTVSGDSAGELEWSGEGWSAETSRERLELSADSLAGTLWISPFESWAALRERILAEASAVLSQPRPPDLREAALQATTAGAGAWEQVARMRSLLCNSFSLETDGTARTTFRVSAIQELLDRRSATPLEMAVLLAAMCLELGIPAEILPASAVLPALPVPDGWERFLLRVGDPRRPGDTWIVEPSAFLAPAFFVPGTDTLYLLGEGEPLRLPPDAGQVSLVREAWRLDPETGRFALELVCRGWFDAALRRRMAGLDGDEMCLVLAEWAWRSGRLVAPDSVRLSDPFDLALPVTLQAAGAWSLPETAAGARCEMVPRLAWGEPENLREGIARNWRLPGGWTPPALPGLEFSGTADSTVLTLDGALSDPFPVTWGFGE